MSKRKLQILVDGSSYLFRAFHALPPLTNSQGEATGAIVGVTNMIRSLIDEYQPDYVGIVFDAPGKTFRHDLFSDYKGHRPPMPDDLRCQIEPIHRVVEALGLPLIMVSDVEADDVIGTLAMQGTQAGLRTVISTGDKDLAQLVNEHVSLINTMNNTVLDNLSVLEKFNVRPDQIIDYLALVGDTADNIPGIPKCGAKTAAKWLESYHTIDGIIENKEKIKGKVGESLRDNLEQLRLSQILTTIKLDVVLDEKPTELIRTPQDTESLREIFTRIESNRLLSTLDDATPFDEAIEPEIEKETLYTTILTQDALDTWIQRLSEAKLFAFDTETTSLNYMQAEIVGVSFAIEPYEAAYLPLKHDYLGAPDQLDREQVLTQLKPLLEDAKHSKVGQNLKYDKSVLANHGINLRGIVYDTMLESYVTDSTATRHDMDSLAEKYLQHKNIKFEDVAGKGKKQLTFNQVSLELAAPYAAEDADITLRLHLALTQKLEQVPLVKALFHQIEMPLVPVLSRIERTGVLLDCDLLNKQSQELGEKLVSLEQRAYEEAGHPFNLNSPKQIGTIFFDELDLPILKKTPKGAPSTGEAVLVQLAEMGHDLPKIILEHRGLNKLKTTYTDKLPKLVDSKTGRVHTSYHQAVAATGRLSSSDPNLQNIPVRNSEGRRIRQAFIAPEGYKMLAADYSQIELRIMAHLSADKGLVDAFNTGLDVHKATAAEVFGCASEDVTSDQRRSAKAINFGLIYGMSAFGLAKQLDIGRQEAQQYVDLYFQRYPGVQEFMNNIRAQAHQDGFVETLYGRRLYLPEINSRNKMRQAGAERTAINAPMQGTASDIIKLAMLKIDDWLETEQPPVRMIMQVHDELVFEVKENYLETAQTLIKQYMEQAASLDVPLIVDIGVGDNWDEAH